MHQNLSLSNPHYQSPSATASTEEVKRIQAILNKKQKACRTNDPLSLLNDFCFGIGAHDGWPVIYNFDEVKEAWNGCRFAPNTIYNIFWPLYCA